MGGRAWTAGEVREQQILFLEGATPAEAAAGSGRTKAAVAVLRQRKGWRAGGHRPPIDVYKRSLLVRLLGRGLSLNQAAKAIGKRHGTVWKTARRLVEDGILVKVGSGTAARYRPSPSWGIQDD